MLNREAESRKIKDRPQDRDRLQTKDRPLDSRPLDNRPLDSRPQPNKPQLNRPLDNKLLDNRMVPSLLKLI